MTRTKLYSKAKGHMAQYEDDWYLIEDDDGTKYVVHEWDHVRVRDLSSNSGSQRYEIGEFLEGPHEDSAQKALKQLLGL